HIAVLVKEASLRVQDAVSGREKFRTSVKEAFSSGPLFSSDGCCLVARAKDVLHVWDTTTWKLLQSVPLQPGEVEAFDVWADGGAVAFLSHLDSAVHVWDLAKKRPLREFPGHRRGRLIVAFSADGTEVVTTERHAPCFDEVHPIWSLRRWDAVTGEEKLRVI